MSNIEEIKRTLDTKIISQEFINLESLTQWFQSVEIDGYEKWVKYNENNYNRIHLINSAHYELLILCWKPGQETPLHGHPNQGCLIKILVGSLDEEIRSLGKPPEFRHHKVNGVSYICDEIGYHKVSNASDENVVSLHLYAPGGYDPTSLIKPE